ncbi:hypothetical protein LWI28_027798 [Acer negundo]|uniref:60S acidic ribosomal protein P1 n=1 Tax=Acer negundo TaxID=4023 RepID=A0AAD5NJ71_ACENE|nr:hypothetical protein LWI28_027798 [Acer negundo]
MYVSPLVERVQTVDGSRELICWLFWEETQALPLLISRAFLALLELNVKIIGLNIFLALLELIASGRGKLASIPSGGGVAVAMAASGGGAAAESKKEEKVEEKKESDDDMGFSLFD